MAGQNTATEEFTSYLPMYLSSSVSASPMNSNLKSLREWANFLWAAERSAWGEKKRHRLRTHSKKAGSSPWPWNNQLLQQTLNTGLSKDIRRHPILPNLLLISFGNMSHRYLYTRLYERKQV